MVCPNKNSLEWKKLVSEVGETFAAKVFIASGNMLPEMSIINKYIDEIKSSAKFFIVDKGMPFSGDLINKVKLNQQKFTIRQNFHNQGVYKIDINESLEVIPLSKEPITFNDALNILNISKNNFIEQFKGKSNIKIPQINDFLNNQNKLYVYKLNYLSTQPLQQSTVRKTYSGKVTSLQPNQIFVFGSNEGSSKGAAPTHGAGSAKIARDNFGAVQGQSRGLQGQSYAIVTKKFYDVKKSSTPQEIIEEIKGLYEYAKQNPTKEFLVSDYSESNLNGYTGQEMANMFNAAGPIPFNIVFNENFDKLVNSTQQQSSVRPSTGLTDAQILNSPNFAAFYLKELESNPDLSTEDALEYYKKCKQ